MAELSNTKIYGDLLITGDAKVNNDNIWHSGNDGSGTGLDADKLDGQEGTYYLDWTNTTNKPDPTITLSGDASGSVTLTDLGNGTLSVTVADDSHNHIISNVDGLQTSLDGKSNTNHTHSNATVSVSGFMSSADKTKLDGIESGATGDQSASEILTLLKTVDGSGSGLDADTLDGQQGSYYLDWNNTTNKPDPTITLSGDASGSVTLTDLGSSTLNVTVANDSHTHDSRYIRKDTNDTSTGYISAEGFVNAGNGSLSIFNPHNASYATTNVSVTGAIKITLPVSWTSTMMRLTIRIYEYTTNESFDVVCGGYNHSAGSSWVNTFAYILGSPNVNRNFNVRFGHDGTKCCIYIGEITSAWSYPQVAVTQLVAGYANYGADTWNDNWDVNFATSFGTITSTISNCEIGRFVDNNLVFHEGYHPNADKWTTARTLSLSGDATGSVSWDGSNNATLSVRIADDSHTHIISNIDGLQAALDSKLNLTGGTITGNLTIDAGTSTTLSVKCDDTGLALIRANGDNQGTGALEVGQSNEYGGGISYNGDNSPAFVTGESADNITFYRLSAGVRTEVFNYSHNSNDVNFNGNITLTGTVDGRDIAVDGTKLDGIESGATGDQTASEILTLIKTVDGSGSGLDSDTIDGLQSTSFLRSDANDTSTGIITLSGAGSDRLNIYNTTSGGEVGIRFSDVTSQTQNGYFRFRHEDSTSPGNAYGANFEFSTDQPNLAVIIDGSGDYFVGTSKVWNEGNDGSGSGLDADLLDGLQGSNYARTDIEETFTNDVIIQGSGSTIGGSDINNATLRIGSNLGLDSNEIYFQGDIGNIGTIGNYGLGIKVNGNITYFKEDGNVGIGTTAPSEKLHVTGNVRAEQYHYDTYAYSTYNTTTESIDFIFS